MTLSAFPVAKATPFDTLTIPAEPALVQALNTALGQLQIHDICVEQVAIDRIRNKPDEKIIIGATARCRQSGQKAFQQLLGIRIFPAGLSANRLEKAMADNPTPSPLGPGVLHLEEISAVAWLFPNDRKISGLNAIMHETAFEKQALPALRKFLPGAPSPSLWEIKVLRYVPEQSCTLKLALIYDENGVERRTHFIGKCASDKRGAIGFRAMARICENDQQNPICPEAVHYDNALNLQWQRMVSGSPRPASAFLNLNNNEWTRVTKAIRRVHQTPADDFREVSIKRDIETLAARIDMLAELSPSLRQSAQSIAKCLTVSAADMGSGPSCLLHGDLHPGNFLFDGDHLRLIDFDCAYSGAAENDLGSFIAALIATALRQDWPDQSIFNLHQMIASEYGAHSSEGSLNHRRLHWRIAFSLLTERVYRALTRMKPGRTDTIPRLLSWAERLSDADFDQRAAHG